MHNYALSAVFEMSIPFVQSMAMEKSRRRSDHKLMIQACLEFVELLRYQFVAPGHINVLETRVYKTWIKWCARRHPRSRLLGLIDSRVLLGEALVRPLRAGLQVAPCAASSAPLFPTSSVLPCTPEACMFTLPATARMVPRVAPLLRPLPRVGRLALVASR